VERKAKSYLVYFCLVLALCTSAFLFGLFSHHSELEHSFTYSNLWYFTPSRTEFTVALANFFLKLVTCGGPGLLGLYFLPITGFKNILNDEIKKSKNIFLVIIAGMIMGGYFIGYETLSYKIFKLHLLPYNYSMIPSAIFNSLAEGIGDQISQMLYISVLVWFFSKHVKSESGHSKLFWRVAAVCALGFIISHIPTTFFFAHHRSGNFLYLRFHEFIIITGLYGPLALVCAYFMKRFGLLSAVIIHFITDIMWRVLWAWIQMGNLLFK
jgi:hypothetical protein